MLKQNCHRKKALRNSPETPELFPRVTFLLEAIPTLTVVS